MKLTITHYLNAIPGNYTEIRMVLYDGKTEHTIQEFLPNDLCKDGEIMRRSFDKMFYEMRKMVDKNLEFQFLSPQTPLNDISCNSLLSSYVKTKEFK